MTTFTPPVEMDEGTLNHAEMTGLGHFVANTGRNSHAESNIDIPVATQEPETVSAAGQSSGVEATNPTIDDFVDVDTAELLAVGEATAMPVANVNLNAEEPQVNDEEAEPMNADDVAVVNEEVEAGNLDTPAQENNANELNDVVNEEVEVGNLGRPVQADINRNADVTDNEGVEDNNSDIPAQDDTDLNEDADALQVANVDTRNADTDVQAEDNLNAFDADPVNTDIPVVTQPESVPMENAEVDAKVRRGRRDRRNGPRTRDDRKVPDQETLRQMLLCRNKNGGKRHK
ncbi:hypothetical protein BC829DRAFT_399200 [Chytridium lagenaria]|nr:hypothetical protein BC829DRAFT_399200 [Chytridium lagenaria]